MWLVGNINVACGQHTLFCDTRLLRYGIAEVVIRADDAKEGPTQMAISAKMGLRRSGTSALGGGYIGGMASSFALRGGGMWAWSDIDTSRAVVFPGFYERQKANYDADTGQLFGEVAYPTQMGGVALEPFGGLAFVSVDTDSFRERGGTQASLRGVNVDQDVGYTSLGLRAASTMMWGTTQVTPHISAAWLHAFDDVTPGASLAFATTGIGFSVAGVPLAEDSALLDAGLDFALGERMTAGVSYTGQYSDSVTDNGVKGRFTWLF
jgi:outer membrane autotransporter protein